MAKCKALMGSAVKGLKLIHSFLAKSITYSIIMQQMQLVMHSVTSAYLFCLCSNF